MTERAIAKRVRDLLKEWDILRFGLSEREAAEAWAESMARHEAECPLLRSFGRRSKS